MDQTDTQTNNCSCLRVPREIRARERGRAGAWLHTNEWSTATRVGWHLKERLMPRTTRSEGRMKAGRRPEPNQILVQRPDDADGSQLDATSSLALASVATIVSSQTYAGTENRRTQLHRALIRIRIQCSPLVRSAFCPKKIDLTSGLDYIRVITQYTRI